MKINIKHLIFFLTFIVIGVNLLLFAKTLSLGDEILKTESNIKAARVENAELSKKLYSINSLQNLTKQAKELGFTNKTEPMYLDNLKYALAN